VSCARCHPISLYGADGLRKAIGNNCRTSPRNVPTVLNAAGQISEHWIGNRESVEDQARQSIAGPASFGMPTSDSIEAKLSVFPDYESLFKSAFPNERAPVTAANFGLAVGAFERTLVTPSPFDSFLKGEENALTVKQKAGLDAFLEIGCVTCHSGPYVGGQMYQKFGIFEPYWQYTKSEQVDEGRSALTKSESDRYVFKVPVLRNVEKTPPYFHDGSVDKLENAVSIMGKIQLGKELSELQVAEITSFLESLTGEIPADALKVPLLPTKKK
jgi:cytochrome c peroxidase